MSKKELLKRTNREIDLLITKGRTSTKRYKNLCKMHKLLTN